MKKTKSGVDLEAVAKALSSKVSRSNKWKEMQKAMPPTYQQPEKDIADIIAAMKDVPDPVATGPDPDLYNEDEYVDEGYGDEEPPMEVDYGDSPAKPMSVADAMTAKKQPGLFDTPVRNKATSSGTFGMPTNLSKKLRGDLKTKEPERFPMVDTMAEEEMVIPSNENDVDMIRQSLVIERVPERMRIIAVAVDLESASGNDINLIKCNGDPLGCQAYNAEQDGYYVHCSAYIDLGPIPVAYRIKGQGSTDNNNIIALPTDLIEKYLSPTQKKTLKLFREKYNAPRFGHEYMQAITC